MRYVIYFSTSMVSIVGMFLLSRKASASIKGRRYPMSINIFCVGMQTFYCSSCSITNLHFISRLLTNAKRRIGRRNVMKITDHPLFDGVDWRTLPNRKVIFLVFLCGCCSCYILEVAPTGFCLPQSTYTESKVVTNTGVTGNDPIYEESLSQGYPFSVFFKPSSSISPGLTITRPSPGPIFGNASNSVLRSSLSTNFDSTRSAS